ncbi:MAG: hypothetical protein ACKOZU_00430 [Planctomycetaceae bacterium]
MNAPIRRPPPAADRAAVATLSDFLVARRAGLGAVAVVAAAAAAGWYAWHRHAADVQAHPDAVLFPDAIEVRGTAAWVRGDVRAEALRDASLDAGLPLDDPALTERLRRAFARHPWVREVVGVAVRSPAAATVEIRCREPVAMVRVKGGLYAVDAEGTLLPSDDFTPESASAYPTIGHVQSTPQGTAGTRWLDPLVVEGAALAAAIGPEWPRLGVRDLRPAGTAAGISWDLVGDGGRVIRFGFAPGRERPGEPSAAVKVARLRDLVAREALDGGVDLAAPPAEPPVPVSGGDPAPASARP